METRVLFISWDGPAQNYMGSLFLPIFDRVQKQDPQISIRVLQFTWGDPEITAAVAAQARDANIGYEVSKVLRKPLAPATAAMLFLGALEIVKQVRAQGIDILFPRAPIPAAMTLIARDMLPDIEIFYDADGFMADERAEFGGWSASGLMYRMFRDVEAQICRRASAIMTRTQHAKEILYHRVGGSIDPAMIHVIPNAKDAHQFHPATPETRQEMRAKLGLPQDAPVAIYVGSLGPQYHPAELLDFFESIAKRDAAARFVILTGNRATLDPLLATRTHLEKALTITRVAPEEVPAYVAAADLGVAFRTPSFSQLGVCPIKVGEYLLCGVPVLSSAGIGDLDEQLGGQHTGRLVPSLDSQQLDAAAGWFLGDVIQQRNEFRERCRRVGTATFGMEQCTERYIKAIRACSSAP